MSHRAAQYDAVHQEATQARAGGVPGSGRLRRAIHPGRSDPAVRHGGDEPARAGPARGLRRYRHVGQGCHRRRPALRRDLHRLGRRCRRVHAHPPRLRDRGAGRDALPPHHVQRDHRRNPVPDVPGGGRAARRRHVLGADGAADSLGPVRPRLRRRSEEPRPRRHGHGLHPEIGRGTGGRVRRPLPALRRPPRQGVAVQHPADVHHRDGRQGC